MAVLTSTVVIIQKRSMIDFSATNLFGSPLQCTIYSVSSAGTPKIDGLFVTAYNGMGVTYTGALDFLEGGNQAVFNSIFDVSSTPLSLSRSKKLEVVVNEISSLCERIKTFTSLYHLLIYCSIVVLYTDTMSECLIMIAHRS